MVHAWDAKPATGGAPSNLFSSESGGVALQNVIGRLAAVASHSAGAWQATLMSYDVEGRVVRRHTFTENMSGTGVIAAASQTVEYERDLRGELTERRLTVGSLTFNHWYEHTGRGLLGRVYASTSSGKPSTPDAVYSYRPSGAVASRQFLGGSAVPLLYTVREELETIGDPATTAHPFAARYTYHPNGLVSESEFYSAGAPGGGAATANRYRYVYGAGQYDALGRLLGATYQGWTGSWSSTLAHNLTGISYDPSGNITAMRRYRDDGTLIDDLTYSYPGTSNRLSSVTDVAPATLGWDAQSGSFSYDANGNMTSSPAPYSVTGAAYDHRNLPTALTSGSTTTAYRYDHAGQRTHKRVGSGNTEIYVLEGTVTLGVVTVDGSGAVVSSTFNVIADGQVIGRQETGGPRLHYHRDLLGSTRAVVQGTTVVESYDYDPWGVLMPGRTLAGTTREGFTTKERDGETGLDYFGARYYMAALGRWAAVDPLVDSFPEWSGYNYVLGNPLLLIDPDGRSPCGPEESAADCIKRLWDRAQEIGAEVVRFARDAAESLNHLEGLPEDVQTGPGTFVEALGPGAALRARALAGSASRRMAGVRTLGRAGERAVARVPGMTRNTQRFGNRIPDFIDDAGNLVEVKNVRRLSFTRQLRDLQAAANQQPGRKLILYTRHAPCGGGVSGPCTWLSGPLKQEIDSGRIIHRVIPW